METQTVIKRREPKVDKYLLVPLSLYDKILTVAEVEGISINKAAVLLLKKGVEKHVKEKGNRPKNANPPSPPE